MTYDEIVTHVITTRFKESLRSKVQLWVGRRYAQVWSMADWPWKEVPPEDLSVTAGDNTPTVPEFIERPRMVFDNVGTPLQQMSAQDFDRFFIASQIEGGTGVPSAWKWENGVLTLGRTPTDSATYKISYLRRICHLNSSSTVVDGPMSADADTPIWGNRLFDYLLVPGAIATGLKEENDPTWEPLEMEFRTIIDEMREFYLPTMRPYGNAQYGRDDGI